jgi:hypothetical protein
MAMTDVLSLEPMRRQMACVKNRGVLEAPGSLVVHRPALANE